MNWADVAAEYRRAVLETLKDMEAEYLHSDATDEGSESALSTAAAYRAAIDVLEST